jgi:DNA methylase.
LDCFAGSGVVGQAAKILGRKAILVEIEGNLCHKISQRCSTSAQELPKAQPKNFDWKQEPLFQSLLKS